VRFSGNTVIGNQGPGLTVGHGSQIFNFHGNNLYENGTSIKTPFTVEPRQNCGLFNAKRLRDRCTGNFWGLASGPGAEPAERRPGLRRVGSVTKVAPVAIQPLPIKPAAQ
jgi:hypothetical protein